MSNEKLAEEVENLRKKNNEVEVRLTLAQAWVGFLTHAFDALLHHGVNYRDLKEYKDTELLDDAQDLPITHARDNIVGWLGTLHNGIRAAIRRKGFKVH